MVDAPAEGKGEGEFAMHNIFKKSSSHTQSMSVEGGLTREKRIIQECIVLVRYEGLEGGRGYDVPLWN